jgi:predicted anti-sigma-YlaC factor YlaD
MIDCDEARRAIAARLAGDADDMAAGDLDRHLGTCDACSHDAEALEQGLDLLGRGEVPDPGPAYWAAFGGRVRGRIEGWQRRRAWRRSAWALAAAAVLATGVALQALRVDRVPLPERSERTSVGTEDRRVAEARLQALLDRASAAEGGRTVLRTVLDQLGPGHPLALDEALEALSPEESAELGREISGLEG